MADRPILFSAPMILAIIREIEHPGTGKTQTRLALKPQPELYSEGRWHVFGPWGGVAGVRTLDVPEEAVNFVRIQPGDRIWVKEGWCDEHPLAIQAGRYSQPGTAGIPGPPPVSYRTIYRVDGEPLHIWRSASSDHPYFTLDGPSDEIAARYPTVSSNFNRRDGKGVFWNSARYMPRWASRLTLYVTDVRVDRLQDITNEDCIAEGVPLHPNTRAPREGPAIDDFARKHGLISYYGAAYRDIWKSINGAGAWDANPWVVAYTFIPRLGNIDTLPATLQEAA